MECLNTNCGSIEFTQDMQYVVCVECGTIRETLHQNSDIDNIWEQYEKIKIKEKKDRLMECTCEEEIEVSEVEGTLVCMECGFVKEVSVVSDEKDWNNYTNSMGALENKSRCPTLSTTLNPFFKEKTFRQRGYFEEVCMKVCAECEKPFHQYSDTKCIHCASEKFYWKNKKYDPAKLQIQLNYNHKEYACNLVHQIIENVCSAKYPPNVIRVASLLWNDVMISDKLTRGGVRRGLIACCVYYACQEVGCSRTTAEIRGDFRIKNSKQFNQGDCEFREIFEFSEKWSHLITKSSVPEDFIIRFCDELDLDFKFAQRCVKLTKTYNLFSLPVMPKSTAAAVIFYQCTREKIKRTKTLISQKLKVCIPTLSKTIKKVEKRIRKMDTKRIHSKIGANPNRKVPKFATANNSIKG